MTLYGNGRAALLDDPLTAEKLDWGERRRALGDPEVVLVPRDGDPRCEPWIAPAGWEARPGAAGVVSPSGARDKWTYLPAPPGVLRYLRQMAEPAPATGWRVALAGLGRVGGTAASSLVSVPSAVSGIAELLVMDVDASNQERWLLELGSIGEWRGTEPVPRVRPTTLADVFTQCDVFVFAAATAVPPLGTEGDVRVVQLAPNRRILRAFLEQARAVGYTGLFLVVSDPVDWLSLAAFVDSNSDSGGRFTGGGLAPERVAGLGLGVMWARAMAAARREGWDRQVSVSGGIFGPHDVDVVAFDDLERPSRYRSDLITRAAREANYLIRHLGFLPFVGPGVSSLALTLPALLSGREVLASVLVDGVYFGAPARCRWGVLPSPVTVAPEVAASLGDLHERLRSRASSLGLQFA